MTEEIPRCPHCEEGMFRWRTPDLSTWSSPWIWVCFNDECGYFARGWGWMLERFQVQASYRYKYDPETGERGPLPVWSMDALKNGILQDV